MAKPYKYMFLWKRQKRTWELKHVSLFWLKKRLILTLLDKQKDTYHYTIPILM